MKERQDAQSHLEDILGKASNDENMRGAFDEGSDDIENHPDTPKSLKECISTITEYIGLLNELHPSIEALRPLSDSQGTVASALDAEPVEYSYFSDHVRSKFSAIPHDLANALGKLNFDRMNRMSAMRKANLIADTPILQTTSVVAPSTAYRSKDSGLGSSIHSQSSVRAPSLFSALAGASRSKLPKLPEQAKKGSFVCDYCCKNIWISNKRDWE